MSAEFTELSKVGRATTTAMYFALIREVEENRSSRSTACIQIQCLWRGYNARKYIQYLK